MMKISPDLCRAVLLAIKGNQPEMDREESS